MVTVVLFPPKLYLPVFVAPYSLYTYHVQMYYYKVNSYGDSDLLCNRVGSVYVTWRQMLNGLGNWSRCYILSVCNL